MPVPLRPTLRLVFILSLVGLALSLALLFFVVFRGSEKTIYESADRFRDLISREVVARVTANLDEAPLAVGHFERLAAYGLVDPWNPGSVQNALLSLLLANSHISEASFTFGASTGFDKNGDILINRQTEGEVTVYRDSVGQMARMRVWFDGGKFISTTESLSPQQPPAAQGQIPVEDPASHLTFSVPAREDNKGRQLWTDLHWSQIDSALPQNQRRVEVGVVQAIYAGGKFAGVLRVGLFKRTIDSAVRFHIGTAREPDPHLIFLCDGNGRLITGFGTKGEHIAEFGDYLRVTGPQLPASVLAALKLPELQTLAAGKSVHPDLFADGMIYFSTFRRWPQNETQDWIVGIVVPSDFYRGPLQRTRRQILMGASLLMAFLVVAGGLVVHGVDRAHSMILRETSRMKAFEFAPSHCTSSLRDVGDVLFSLERAKTAMRAMSKYVPVDLVRRLYHEGREPELGAETIELSVLFTDIASFTPVAERVAPGKLAEILGLYLQAVAAVIQQEKGTIDKFIGDSVMAFWNAPEPVPGHAILACRAALRCREALRRLYDSTEWADAPHFGTRFGLHTCTASVGHFGAPDRFNYTAIGDGINLASRLEGLNKQYGTVILASETTHAAAKDVFDFRLLDRVAVKGKSQGIAIYELIAERTADSPPLPSALDAYEKAFGAFQKCDFKAALALLEPFTSEDPPSRLLTQRCEDFLQTPPPAGWDGVRAFDTK